MSDVEENYAVILVEVGFRWEDSENGRNNPKSALSDPMKNINNLVSWHKLGENDYLF